MKRAYSKLGYFTVDDVRSFTRGFVDKDKCVVKLSADRLNPPLNIGHFGLHSSALAESAHVDFDSIIFGPSSVSC